MKIQTACALLIVAFVSCCSAGRTPNSYAKFMQKFGRVSKLAKTNPAQQQKQETRDIYRPGLPGGFKCKVLAPSPTKPTNARFVRPSDIQVVAALGDSITAANGVTAWTVPGVLLQDRGLSWCIGGDDDINKVLTLPNIIKKYNSKVYGYSLGSSYSEDTPDAYYNVASAGDTAYDLPVQVVRLVQKIKADKRQDEWKIITIFIGGNDVCEYCNYPDMLSPAAYKTNVGATIDVIYTNFKNTIVNLAGPLDMTQVTTLPDGLACSAVHRGVCGCAYNKSDPTYANRMSHLYQQKAQELVNEAPTRWPRADFALSYQPQYTRLVVPMDDGEPDLSYMAPDCFHFSQKGHESAAITLWNNMVTPPELRATSLQFGDRSMICPTDEKPYILI